MLEPTMNTIVWRAPLSSEIKRLVWESCRSPCFLVLCWPRTSIRFCSQRKAPMVSGLLLGSIDLSVYPDCTTSTGSVSHGRRGRTRRLSTRMTCRGALCDSTGFSSRAGGAIQRQSVIRWSESVSISASSAMVRRESRTGGHTSSVPNRWMSGQRAVGVQAQGMTMKEGEQVLKNSHFISSPLIIIVSFVLFMTRVFICYLFVLRVREGGKRWGVL